MKWRSLALLHNLCIEEPIVTEYLAIVPPEDERALPLLQSSKALARMVGSFTDQFKRKVRPSLLLAKSDAPAGALSAEALVAFRNSVALSTIVQASQEFAVRAQAFNLLRYSNYFQIYPTVASDDDYLITRTPSLLAINEPKEFRGQTSPELAPVTPRGVFYDEELFEALVVAWKERYAKEKKKDWQTRALFRSLEMAFLASGIPFENNATIYDYGASISLWVSALEILFHPGKANVNKKRVMAGIGSYRFNAPALSKRRYRIHLQKAKVSVTLVQKIAAQLYDVRNDFLHGNDVAVSSLFPFERTRRHPLTLYAPMVYKTALAGRLALVRGDDYSAYSMTQFMSVRNLEEALLSSLRDLEPRRKA
ncbi:MAG: hypothetical protein HY900_16095 [Deltaproteobacteria bacterium]|nr:hypothetical protein [Deltaproteobacteria bacterium]